MCDVSISNHNYLSNNLSLIKIDFSNIINIESIKSL